MLGGINPLMMTAAGAAGSGVGAVFDIQVDTAANLDALSTTGWNLLIGKSRANATNWVWRDSVTGLSNRLASNTTAAPAAFTSYATHLGSGNAVLARLKESPAFFDIVTFSGNGAADRAISHSLTSPPGLTIVRRVDATSQEWDAQHRTLSPDDSLWLNSDSPGVNYGGSSVFTAFPATAPDSSVFRVGAASGARTNVSGVSYVAHLFGHDTSPAGLIQCLSFTTDGSGNGTLATGWANGAQFAMIKCVTLAGDWEFLDNLRTPGFSGSDARLRVNLSDAEDSVTRVSQSAGTLSFTGLSTSRPYIAVVVRAP